MKRTIYLYMCLMILALTISACGKGSAPAETGPATEAVTEEQPSEESVPEVPEAVTEESVLEETEAPMPEIAESEEESVASETEATIPETVEEAEEGEAPSVEEIYLDPEWAFAEESVINDGCAVLYRAEKNRRDIVVGVNAGHGTKGGRDKKTYCHPDHTEKVTGGTTKAGSLQAVAVSGGMEFRDGTPEPQVTLRMAQILRDQLLEEGYDVLMLRDGDDVQLDNVARTAISNQVADCHIALHWDGDGLSYDKGCFYCSVPQGIREMYPVNETWEEDHRLGDALIAGLSDAGFKIHNDGSVPIDLTQTSYSMIPSIDIELGNERSEHDDDTLSRQAAGLVAGINEFFKNGVWVPH